MHCALSTGELGGGDDLHGFRDLLDILDGFQALFDLAEGGIIGGIGDRWPMMKLSANCHDAEEPYSVD